MKKITAVILLLAVLAVPVFAEGHASIVAGSDFFWGTHRYQTNDNPNPFQEMSFIIGFEGANFFEGSSFGVEYGAGTSMVYAERQGDDPLAISTTFPWDFYFNIGLGYKFVEMGMFTGRVGFGFLGQFDFTGQGAAQYEGVILDFYASVKAMFRVAERVSIDVGVRFATPLYSARFSGNDSQEKISGASVLPALSVTFWY